MKKLRALALVAVLIVAACAAQADPVTLAYKFRAGEIDKYKLTMKMDFSIAGLAQVSGPNGPVTVNMSVVVRQKTLGVYPDGSAKVAISCGEPQMRMSGMPPLPKSKQPWKAPSITMVLAPDGSLRKIEGLEKAFAFKGAKDIDLGSLRLSQLTSFLGQNAVFPSDPLEVGQTWENTIPLPFGGSELKVTSALVTANAAVGRTTAAKVEQTFDGSLDFSDMLKSFASMMPANATGRDMLSQVTGGLEVFGKMDYFFSPELGKVLRGGGEMVANMSMKLPEQLIKMGGPPQIDVTANIDYTLNRL